MRTLIRTIAIVFSPGLLFTQCEQEPDPYDPVDIPDQAFLNALIEEGIDSNGDGKVSYGEAELVTDMDLDDCVSISSVEGIEAFINLEVVHFCYTQIQTLDLSSNTELRFLYYWNVDNHKKLEYLNISNNKKLEIISIINSQLKNLDVSNNTQLNSLTCSGSNLLSLDVSNNFYLGSIYLTEMPTLTEVCVWTLPFPPEGVEIDTTGSPNVYFTTQCDQ